MATRTTIRNIMRMRMIMYMSLVSLTMLMMMCACADNDNDEEVDADDAIDDDNDNRAGDDDDRHHHPKHNQRARIAYTSLRIPYMMMTYDLSYTIDNIPYAHISCKMQHTTYIYLIS